MRYEPRFAARSRHRFELSGRYTPLERRMYAFSDSQLHPLNRRPLPSLLGP